MAEYINKSKLEIHEICEHGEWVEVVYMDDIREAPTIDIVRCEDCFYYDPEVDDPHISNCQRPWGGMIECNPDSYCSDGAPKKEVK